MHVCFLYCRSLYSKAWRLTWQHQMIPLKSITWARMMTPHWTTLCLLIWNISFQRQRLTMNIVTKMKHPLKSQPLIIFTQTAKLLERLHVRCSRVQSSLEKYWVFVALNAKTTPLTALTTCWNIFKEHTRGLFLLILVICAYLSPMNSHLFSDIALDIETLLSRVRFATMGCSIHFFCSPGTLPTATAVMDSFSVKSVSSPPEMQEPLFNTSIITTSVITNVWNVLIQCSTQGELQRHNMVHSGTFPFSCQICGYSAGRRDYLNKHLTVAHGEDMNKWRTNEDSSGVNSPGLKRLLKKSPPVGGSKESQWMSKRNFNPLCRSAWS